VGRKYPRCLKTGIEPVDGTHVGNEDGAEVMGEEERETALRTLLARYPEAPVAAINSSGIYVEMPSSVPLTGHRLIDAGSSLHFVVPADRKGITDAFHRATIRGLSTVAVRLAKDPARTANMSYFDVRARHGVLVLVIADYSGDDDVQTAISPGPVTPRFACTKKSETSVFLDVDESTTRMLGWSRDQMVGRRSIDFIHPDDHGRAIDSWMAAASRSGEGCRARLRHLCRDGSWRWLEITNTTVVDDAGQNHVLGELADISDEMAALEEVRVREQLLAQLANALPLGLFQLSRDLRVSYTNVRLHQIVGASSEDTVDGLLGNLVPADRPLLDRAIDAALNGGDDGEVEVRFQLPDAEHRTLCQVALRALTGPDDQVTGAIVCVTDVTESSTMREDLKRLAMIDPLTNCHNRRSIMSALEGALGGAADDPLGVAAIFVDIDDFKRINDTHGHAAGDELLSVAADRLGETVRANDIVGRIGGDEFLIFCPGVQGTEEAMVLAERVADALRRDVYLAGGRIALRASVGVTWSKVRRTNADRLVGRADAAMYESKRLEMGRPVLFHPRLKVPTQA
jgi:diguanylate cyclase (GGDEF)-like protein/PAS domain S-box-containing protein